MGKKYLAAISMIVLLILTACTSEEAPTLTPSPVAEVGQVIVLGDIDQDDPISKIEEFQPIIDYLADGLGEFGIGGGEVRIASDMETMIGFVNDGLVDIYYDSLFPAMIVANGTDATPLLRGWRGGEPIYHSVFFALADSGITTLEDLNGKIVAYDDVGSTSGYMIPAAYLISNGLNPVEKTSAEVAVADDEVGYVFSNDDENTIEWVLSGRVDAGVVDNLTFLKDIPEETMNSLVIIAETESVPRRVIMVSPNIEPELRDAIMQLLTDLDETEEGQALLTILKTTQFDEFPGRC
ncbi:MAG: phosphate/phosphite/phosphonate ABC transporter substrate-binding protein [Anaerolineae bacterium]|nr:phosphate/phosphite/phosphonate ABC transporter substrate-binding protein [Anaerolineae bacterium]